VDGTSIDKWQPGAFDQPTSTHPYDDAVDRIIEAMKHGKIKGMLWLQGESDSNAASVSQYLSKLNILIQRVRELTKTKNLPVVIGELGQFNSNYHLFNNELHKAPIQIKNTTVVSSEGLTDKGDNTHFDSKSLNIFGIRFATQLKKMQ
jgi:hypothetical protein